MPKGAPGLPRFSTCAARRDRRELDAAEWFARPDTLTWAAGGPPVLTYREPEDPCVALAALRHLRAALGEHEHAVALAARADGLSWYDIGRALGITGEAARQRHGERNAYRARLEAAS